MKAIEIRGLDHVVLRVSDLARSLRFYVELLGCSEERRSDALGLVQLRAGASLIDLIDVSSPLGKLGGPAAGAQARNVDHIALQLAHFDAARIARSSRHSASSRATSRSATARSGWGRRCTCATPTATSSSSRGRGRDCSTAGLCRALAPAAALRAGVSPARGWRSG